MSRLTEESLQESLKRSSAKLAEKIDTAALIDKIYAASCINLKEKNLVMAKESRSEKTIELVHHITKKGRREITRFLDLLHGDHGAPDVVLTIQLRASLIECRETIVQLDEVLVKTIFDQLLVKFPERRSVLFTKKTFGHADRLKVLLDDLVPSNKAIFVRFMELLEENQLETLADDLRQLAGLDAPPPPPQQQPQPPPPVAV